LIASGPTPSPAGERLEVPEGTAPERAEPGHRFGAALPADDRAALVAYLETL
jgi:hypothetical protein